MLLHPARLLRRKNVELTLNVTAAIKVAGHSCACLITAPPEIHHAASRAYESALHAIDVYWLVAPSVRPEGLHVAWSDPLALAIACAIWWFTWRPAHA